MSDPNKRRVHYVTFLEETGEILSKGYCQLRTVSAQFDSLNLPAGENFTLVPAGTNAVDHMIDVSDPNDPKVVTKPPAESA
tara:strand:+ start:6153 stop:6395 length:243 start_codon:yes stop_codon:yes gene_type:complete